MNKTLQLSLCFGFSVLLASCASTKIHYVAEGAASNLSQPRHIAIAGILGEGSASEIHPEDRSDIQAYLKKQVNKKRKHLSVSTPILFESIVGRPYPRSGVDRTRISHFLMPSQIERLEKSRFDYVMILVLNTNETWCEVDEDESTDEEHEYDKQGNVISCRRTTTYTTTSRSYRRAAGDFYLFDSRTGKQVWKAESHHTESNSRSSSSTFSYPLPPPHPEPPCLPEVVENMSQSVARKLPK